MWFFAKRLNFWNILQIVWQLFRQAFPPKTSQKRDFDHFSQNDCSFYQLTSKQPEKRPKLWIMGITRGITPDSGVRSRPLPMWITRLSPLTPWASQGEVSPRKGFFLCELFYLTRKNSSFARNASYYSSDFIVICLTLSVSEHSRTLTPETGFRRTFMIHWLRCGSGSWREILL